MRDISRYIIRGGYVYIEAVPVGGDDYRLYPFNITVSCPRGLNVRFRGDVELHLVRTVHDGDLLDHKLYNDNGWRLIPYPHRLRWFITAWGSLNFPGGFYWRNLSVVMYHVVITTDYGVIINETRDSGLLFFTLNTPPRYVEANVYAVIHYNNNTGDDTSNNTGGTLKKPSPIDFSSIYGALGGAHTAPIVLIIVLLAVVAIILVFSKR